MNDNTSHISRRQANKVSRILRDPATNRGTSSYAEAVETVKHWRRQHFQPTCEVFRQLLSVTEDMPDAVISMRLKRLSSILNKVQRPANNFEIGALDDIGGCRCVVENMDALNEIRQRLLSSGRSFKIKDYIESPQSSGYRSLHLIQTERAANYNYRVEIQLRTYLQHKWATGVETLGGLYFKEFKSPLSQNEPNEEENLLFFKIVSALFSLEEDQPCPSDMNSSASHLLTQLSDLAATRRILDDLRTAKDSLCVVEAPDMECEAILVTMSPELQEYEVEPFINMDAALEAYERTEATTENVDSIWCDSDVDEDSDKLVDGYANTVLTRLRDVSKLPIAYPNYSVDSDDFLKKVEHYLQQSSAAC